VLDIFKREKVVRKEEMTKSTKLKKDEGLRNLLFVNGVKCDNIDFLITDLIKYFDIPSMSKHKTTKPMQEKSKSMQQLKKPDKECKHEWRQLRQKKFKMNYAGNYHVRFYCIHCLTIKEKTDDTT